MAKEFWINTEEGRRGPFTSDELRSLAANGKLRSSQEVSLDGKRWYKASSVKGLTFSPSSPEIIEAKVLPDELDGVFDSVNRDELADFFEDNLPPANSRSDKSPSPLSHDVADSGHDNINELRSSKWQVLERPDSNAASIGGKINSWSTTFGDPNERQCPGCKVPLLVGQVLCMNCGYHTILGCKAGTQNAEKQESVKSKDHSPEDVRKALSDRVGKFFLLPFGVLFSLLGMFAFIQGVVNSEDRAETLTVGGFSLAIGIPFLVVGIYTWRKSDPSNRSSTILNAFVLRGILRQLNRCPDCGGRPCVRTIPNSVSKGEIGWSWRTLSICLRCVSVPCMIEGCDERGQIRLSHLYSHIPWFDDSHCPSVPNDLWLCREHGEGMQMYSWGNYVGNVAAVVGAILLGIAFAFKLLVPGVIGALLAGSGIALRVHFGRWFSARGLKKKRQYLMVRPGCPDDVRFDW